MGATVDDVGGTTTARGGSAVGRSIGVAFGLGVIAFTAFGIFSDAAVSLALAPLVLAIPFFFDVASSLAIDFFLLDLDFAVEFDVFLGFDVASSVLDSFFFANFAFGLAPAFGFLDSVEEVVFFFVFGDAAGDASASRVLRNCCRLLSSSSFP